jgi:hypothetical protein
VLVKVKQSGWKTTRNEISSLYEVEEGGFVYGNQAREHNKVELVQIQALSSQWLSRWHPIMRADGRLQRLCSVTEPRQLLSLAEGFARYLVFFFKFCCPGCPKIANFLSCARFGAIFPIQSRLIQPIFEKYQIEHTIKW